MHDILIGWGLKGGEIPHVKLIGEVAMQRTTVRIWCLVSNGNFDAGPGALKRVSSANKTSSLMVLMSIYVRYDMLLLNIQVIAVLKSTMSFDIPLGTIPSLIQDVPHLKESATHTLSYPSSMSSFSFQNIRAIVEDFLWNFQFLAFSVLVIGLLAATNLTTRISYKVMSSSRERVKTPPTVPYTIPFIGHALSFGLDPASFFMGLK